MQSRLARVAACLASLVFACSSSGCAGFFHPAAERTVVVSGVLIGAPADGTCSVRLVGADDRGLGEITVTPRFRRSFVVSPYRNAVRVTIACPGVSGHFRSDEFVVEQGRTQIDLGAVSVR